MDRFDIGRLTDFDISTAAKHGTDLMTAIRDALLGRAWIPPDRMHSALRDHAGVSAAWAVG
ncbi:hypothetical protein OG320_23700 [Microbispora sp. NBC_01189]|uniref:hypothetical protein n=1 Tax=Microbispora sp. NBC_01189 TaxID=2903583 RepID=UPI002E15B292|nr:hypothetical protein OG320_23700 [Microbispora sp. NBC_01189]